MEEVFPLLVVGDESEAFVAHYTFDCSSRHRSSLPCARLLISSDTFSAELHEHRCCGFIFRAGMQ
jgi:hypothetical protein